MREEKKAQIRLFLRYFVPFGALVITVSLIATFWIYRQTSTTVRNEMESQIASSTDSFVEFLENQLLEMDHIAYNLSTKGNLRPYSIFLNNYSHVSANNEFASYVSANSYLDDVFLFYDDGIAARYGQQATLICSRGTREARLSWNVEYAFQEVNYEMLQRLADEKRSAFIIPRLNCKSFYPVADQFIVYAVPNGEGSLILFMINSAKIDAYFRSRLSHYDGAVQVWDETGAEILCVSCGMKVLEEMPSVSESNAVSITNTPGYWLEALYRTSQRGLTYSVRWSAVLYDQLFERAIRVHIPFLTAFFLIAAFFAVWASSIGFRPISQVFRSMASHTKPLTVSFNGIANSIRELETQWTSLQYQMERQKALVRLQVIAALLNGSYNDEMAASKLITENDIELRGGHYCVCILRVMLPQDERRHSFPAYLEKCFPSVSGNCLALEQEEADTFACILSSEKEGDIHDFCKRFYGLICQGLAEGTVCTLGYSSWTDALCEIARAKSQAEAALHFAFFLGVGRSIGFDEVPEEDAQYIIWYPVREEDMLIRALLIGDTETAIDSLAAIEKVLLEMHASVRIARSVLSGIIRRVTSIMSEHQWNRSDAELKRAELDLGSADATLGGIMDQLRQIAVDTCVESGSASREDSESISQKVDTYLQMSFADANLSMASITAEFHISPGYLARIYKQETGRTVIQALDELRLSRAEQLLRETDCTLADICSQCGYIDKGNFIRKFKKKYNATPMRYRDIYKS